MVLREWPRGFWIFCFVVFWWIFEWRLSNLTGFYWNISTASRWFRIDSMSSVSSSLPQSWRNYEGNSWDFFPVKFNRCAYIPEQLGRVLTWTVPQLSEEWLLPVSTPFLNLYYVPEGMTKGILDFLFRWVLMDFQTWPSPYGLVLTGSALWREDESRYWRFDFRDVFLEGINNYECEDISMMWCISRWWCPELGWQSRGLARSW